MSGAQAQGEVIVDDRFVVDTRHPAGHLGGIELCKVRDRHGGAGKYVALRVPRAIPPRSRDSMFAGLEPGRLPVPLARHISGGHRLYITEPIAAPPLIEAAAAAAAERRPWGEAQIVSLLLRPVGQALLSLQEAGLTHRAIRPDNVFGTEEQAAMLGPCWAMAAAWGQDARFESPTVSVCAPQSRGEGIIADDVYALGVLALTLHLGHEPMCGLTTETIIHRKLEHGSLAALTEGERVAPAVMEILRAMLADDPQQRVTPVLLAEMATGRDRRAVRRVVPRAQRPIEIGAIQAWNIRTLAWALGRDLRESVRLLRSGAVSHWLRRSAEAGAQAMRIDECLVAATVDAASQETFDALLVMRVVAILDPGAPLLWDGMWMWPDAVGAVLYQAVIEPGRGAVLEALRKALRVDAVGRWRSLIGRHIARVDPGSWLQIARSWLDDGSADALLRLLYVLNPSLACLSPHLAAVPVEAPAGVVAALESGLSAGSLQTGETIVWMDDQLTAFLCARSDTAELRAETETVRAYPGLRDLVRLAGLQRRHGGALCPALAKALRREAVAVIESWPGRSRRTALLARVDEAVGIGDLPAMLAAITDRNAREQDERQRAGAIERIGALRGDIRHLAAARAGFLGRAQHMAGEFGIGLGLVSLAGAAFLEMFR